jgi:colanic acid/amylovoran biosynthesis glycosyltransferase
MMGSKRIGIVLPNPPGYSETFFHSKIKGLTEAGFEVTLFVNGGSDPSSPYRIVTQHRTYHKLLQPVMMVWVLTLLLLRAPGAFRRFVQLEREFGRSPVTILKNLYTNAHILTVQLDVLHFGFATMAEKKVNAARAVGAKMAVSFRGFDISIYPLKHPGCYNRVWERVDLVHTISDDLYKEALALGLSPEVPVAKITPAIDTKRFICERQKALGTSVQILTVARLHWKKGLDYALTAMKQLHDAGVAFTYTIVGDGPDHERLVFAAHQLGISDRVVFAGRQSHDTIREYMASHEVYLQPSVQEGFCNAVLEAQASGMLCIVSDAQGLAENVLHEVTGWVVPRRQPKVIARQIQALFTMQPTEIMNIGERAAKRVAKEFDISGQIAAFKKLYENL